MITVHHLNNSRSQRVLWLLEELGTDYEIKKYQRNSETMLAPPELKAVHPLGKSPVITDGQTTVAETGAIIDYLITHAKNENLRPAAGSHEALRYTYWMHYAEGSAMTPLLLKLVFDRMPANAPFLVKGLVKSICKAAQAKLSDPQIENHLNYWNAELDKSTWFAGNAFSAADIMMSFPLEAAAARAGARSRPKVAEFLDRIHARPAYQTALDKGGQYDYA